MVLLAVSDSQLKRSVRDVLTRISQFYLLHTHTHTFNGPLSGTTRVSQYQKGKTNLDFTEARDSEWQWHQLGHMQVSTSLQTDNHASTPPLKVFYRPDALPATQPTVSKHWRLPARESTDVSCEKSLPSSRSYKIRFHFENLLLPSLRWYVEL